VNAAKGFNDNECELDNCFVCEVKKYNYLHLRGACIKKAEFDTDYVFYKTETEDFIFQGFSGKSFIIGSSDNDTWSMALGTQGINKCPVFYILFCRFAKI
jgi:hypothetical protein